MGPNFTDAAAGDWFARYTASLMLGAAIGGIALGSLGDRIGRTRAMAVSILFYSAFAGLGGFVARQEEMLVLRFLVGLGVGGMWPNGVVLVSECWPRASRPVVAGIMGAGINFGILLLSQIARSWPITSESWRWIFRLAALLAALGIFVLLALPESPRWLAARRRGAAGKAPEKPPVASLFRSPLLGRTAAGIVLASIPLVGAWAASKWMIPWADKVASAEQPGYKAVVQGWWALGATLGSFAGAQVAAWLGRRLSYFLVSLGTTALTIAMFQLSAPLEPTFLPIVFAQGLVATLFFGWLPLYLPELFPTRVRSTGSGLAMNSGRFATALGVLVSGDERKGLGGLNPMRTGRLRSTLVNFSLLVAVSALAAQGPPEIAHVHPDYPGIRPHLITGEGFEPGATEVWIWEPPAPGGDPGEAFLPGDPAPELPAEPPREARRAEVLDVERQAIVAGLEGSVLWVKTPRGISRPRLFEVARPFWVSEKKAEPGATVSVFGFGLRIEYHRSEIALRSGDRVLRPRTFVEPRALRTADRRLVSFQVPLDAPPGRYEIYCHNSYGGKWGWRRAGDLEVVAPRSEEPKTFDVRAFGARADGLANDRDAIRSAIEAARRSGGGVVFFPPGTYLTDETIVVPSGVRLRGASRESAVLRGTGEPPEADRSGLARVAWFHPFAPPAAVVRLRSRSGLERLSVEGATWRGEGGYGLVEAVPDEISFPIGGEVEDVMVADCRLRALDEDPVTRRPLYITAFHAGPASRRVKLLSNEIFGAAGFGIGGVGQAVRADIIGNVFRGGATNDVVTINGAFSESLIDGNLLVDTPGRICLGMGRHNYIRFNEIRGAFRGTWENAEEVYLVHGGIETTKAVGFAAGGSPTALVDPRQNWRPGLFRDATVLIISGRGFGQYRRVVENGRDALTVDPPWNVIPDATSEYVVAPLFVENAFFANLNDTPCRMSLWLDCVANQVEMHRDEHSKGIDLWGEDASSVDEKGVARGVRKFFPAYYNVFANCWMDRAALWLGTPGAHERNAHRGYPNFGNYVVRNRIREPHAYRTGFDVRPHATAGITVGGGSGRAGTSHTVVAENFVASTYTGVAIAATARKTFLLGNEFHHAERPVEDQGRELPPWEPGPWIPSPSEELAPLFHDVLALKVLVSQPAYCFGIEVESSAREAECERRLKALFKAIRDYEAREGHLPKAAFYPRKPLEDAESLRAILGESLAPYYVCPTASSDLARLGLSYVWNEKLGGRKLRDIANPSEVWLLMDFVGAHDWMVENGFCGHRRGVNALFADGSVRRIPPLSTEVPPREGRRSWLEWARN